MRGLGRWSAVRRGRRSEQGSASLEFLSVGVLLLVPIFYGILSLASVNAAQLAVHNAATSAARLIAQQPETRLNGRADDAIVTALANHELSASVDATELRCLPDPGCSAAGTTVRVHVRLSVPLPLLGSGGPPFAEVESSAAFPVTRLTVIGG